MQSKIPIKSFLVLVGLTVAGVIIFSPAFDLSDRNIYTQAATAESSRSIAVPEQAMALGLEVSSDLPVRLKIPKITVDAAIEYVGLTPLGALDVPKGPVNAAWFKQGPRPGEAGSAIIDGHFGWKNGIPAVFDNLNALGKGDKLYVENEKGSTTAFIVREVRLYGEHDKTSDVFISSDGKSHLVLITCEGVWNKKSHSYSNRLVVFADKVIEE